MVFCPGAFFFRAPSALLWPKSPVGLALEPHEFPPEPLFLVFGKGGGMAGIASYAIPGTVYP